MQTKTNAHHAIPANDNYDKSCNSGTRTKVRMGHQRVADASYGRNDMLTSRVEHRDLLNASPVASVAT